MRFEALELSFVFITALRGPMRTLQTRDPDLFRQLRKPATSIPLNIAEGAGRTGRDRRHHYRIAAGSARESQAALRCASAWGDLTDEELRPAITVLDRLLALLWGLGR